MMMRSTFVAAITLSLTAGAFARLPKGQSTDPLASLSGGGGEPAQDDPHVIMKQVANGMDDIHGQLSDLKTDAPVQAKEKEVTASLDSIIAALEKQCSGNGGANPNPTQGMKKSALAKGPGGSGELHDPQASDKQWGQLKPKEREQILQSKNDGFPAGYESLLQSYYRRLATEDATPAAGVADGKADGKTPDAAATEPKPATPPIVPATPPAAPAGQGSAKP